MSSTETHQQLLHGQADTWSGVGFCLREYSMVMSLHEVRSVERFTQLAPIASAKPWVRGLGLYRGTALLVLDPQGVLYDD
jgi:chemotaxis signal transduction protein